ncbi:MAG: glutathione S-transferase family protein [Burkholderiaceae bacterium]|jgi:glutathione S-transferase|nr:glutathione S-transferase family protein [Burkholderiaceae bacterium]
MSLKLYYASGACSFVPHAMLEAAGATFEPVRVKLHQNEQQSPEYLAINPRGQVPTLVDGAQTITQIVAIVVHIDARFPESQFIPREPLARVRFFETLAWMNNTVHPAFTHVFMPFRFTDDAPAQAALKRFNTGAYRRLLGELQGIVTSAHASGRDWLGGVHFGPLDAYALTLLRWGTLAGIDPESLPELWTYAQRAAQTPAAARAIERERIRLNMYSG